MRGSSGYEDDAVRAVGERGNAPIHRREVNVCGNGRAEQDGVGHLTVAADFLPEGFETDIGGIRPGIQPLVSAFRAEAPQSFKQRVGRDRARDESRVQGDAEKACLAEWANSPLFRNPFLMPTHDAGVVGMVRPQQGQQDINVQESVRLHRHPFSPSIPAHTPT